MCNIAGYVGNRQAAPILVDMMRRQEGMAGGYYTGIVTYCEGRFYSCKLTGDVQRLLDAFDVLNMPGTIGLIHSRSKSGGGDEWAHPFVGRNPQGEEMNYYVANGAVGYFQDSAAAYNVIAQQLLEEGYRYDSRVQLDTPRYQTLKDGSKVHISDVAAQLIARNLVNGMSPARAMEKCFCDMPCELVGLALAAARPDAIIYSASNMPMCIARAEHGMYLSSTALAFPQDGRYVQQLPVHASGYVYADRFEMLPYLSTTAEMPLMDACALSKAREVIVRELLGGEKTCGELKRAVASVYPENMLLPTMRTVYEVLYALQLEGRLQLRDVRLPGAFDDLTAPKTMISLK